MALKAFFFGMGYSSLVAAKWLSERNDADFGVAGTTRTRERAVALADSSYRMHMFDGERPSETLDDDLTKATHVVVSIPPDEQGDPALRLHRRGLDDARNLEWLCYYSSVSVYGDFGGAWIDESAPTVPSDRQSAYRLRAEEEWSLYAASRGVPLLILRLAGIYGPGRSALDKVRSGKSQRIVKPGLVFNRVHVDDIGRTTALAAARRLSGVFNLSDDEPAPPQDLVSYAATLLGVEAPQEIAFEAADLTDLARVFYQDNKRVSGGALKRVLGISLLQPSYREGLDHIHDQAD